VCGIAGVFNHEDAHHLTKNILFAIQHRGQESCGLATCDEIGNVSACREMGLVKNALTEEVLEEFSGSIAIGHVRYPTAGSSNLLNAQPHAIELAEGPHIAICSNGDIINYRELRDRFSREHGFTFKSDNDAELIGRLIAFHHIVEKKPLDESIQHAMRDLRGAYSTLLMYKDKLYAFRDPHGIRPLLMGHITHRQRDKIPANGTVFASESSGFGIVGAKRLRSVRPGEILRLEKDKPITTISHEPKRKRHCVFELIYFSRPDSYTFGEYVYEVRQKIGATLADGDAHIPNDDDLVVMAVPDSSNFVGLGYARRKGAPFEMGLLRNHYVGRTFIQPRQTMRDEGVKQKFNPLPGYFPGKRVVLVDDSIVRGTTIRKLVRMLKGAGAREVHVRIGSPKVIGSCYYGIDTPTRRELIANRMTVPEIAEFLSADSLRYLEVDDFRRILKQFDNYCFACFNLDYIFPPEEFAEKANAPEARVP
jgi:amidophosphoribosyltransferase